MVANNSTKKIKQLSQMDKNILLKSLKSAQKTREKVRKDIKQGKLRPIPKTINSFIGDVA